MATKIIKAQITQRHDTRSNWESVNPVLLEGELGLVSDDPNLYKVGDGRTEWNNLPYRGFDGTLVQEEGTSANAAMSQKAVTEALAKMPGTTGTYPSMHVGTADDLAGRGESVPASFGFRASGGKSIKDGRAYIKRIKGNSVVWNNMADTRHLTGEWSYANDYMRLKNGHIYAFIRTKANAGIYCIPVINGQEKYDYAMQTGVYGIVFTSRYDTTPSNTVIYNEQDSGACALYDLTLMFGAGNEPSTIEEFNARKPIVADEYAYNEGEVIHCNTESIKSVGDNAWDEQWRQGYYVEGTFRESSSQIASANPIKVLPNQEYYINQDTLFYWWFYDEDMQYVGYTYTFGGVFKVPANAKYMHFNGEPDYGTTYKNDIMIRLDHSGWKSDIGVGYEPYWQDTLPLPIICKYFPDGMKSAGSAHDEIRFNKTSGKWEAMQRLGSVDLGSAIVSIMNAYGGVYACVSLADMKLPTSDKDRQNGLLCAKYTIGQSAALADLQDKSMLRFDDGIVYIKDSSYTDAASFKAAMQGVILYYELAEPIVTELDEADQNFRDYYNVADFGTEQSQSSVPSAPFSADIIYQFNAVDMIREHELEITELQKVIATMQAQLASLTNS
jgi:hypothetical protein